MTWSQGVTGVVKQIHSCARMLASQPEIRCELADLVLAFVSFVILQVAQLLTRRQRPNNSRIGCILNTRAVPNCPFLRLY
ncbi:hypothetical protein PAXRUDRAFT_387501 [Paxillus rubicundulus Ve08.2h10]|uniref:Uncharacterized protein n=1 Tax=Paxillus rubicundulus Ve08.2h10 TaxID=930991 RepID=A0A0D0DDK7_9AGAM|nr:hypothetical protein PAXRUDRAFT_387501 [Paxillus rubicundulus Ve08.2h10]